MKLVHYSLLMKLENTLFDKMDISIYFKTFFFLSSSFFIKYLHFLKITRESDR